MHGVLKVRTTEEKAKAARILELKKIDEYNAIVKKYTDQRENEQGKYDENSLSLSQKVLEENPEFYSVWNYRKSIFNQFKETKEHSDLQKLYLNEMKFIEECIQRFPKSYWIWYHRKWISLKLDSCDWERETKLCSKLLNLDLRNFHCWSYRRFIIEHSDIPLEKELEYTTSKIEQNFSNYSSWHQRSSILPKIYTDSEEFIAKLLEEFEFVRNATFTEPKDSSSWIYHKWLVYTIKQIPNSNYIDVFKNELEQINELIELEPECKWPILTSLLLKIDIGGYSSDELKDQINLLIKLDNDHVNYYKSLLNKI